MVKNSRELEISQEFKDCVAEAKKSGSEIMIEKMGDDLVYFAAAIAYAKSNGVKICFV